MKVELQKEDVKLSNYSKISYVVCKLDAKATYNKHLEQNYSF